MSDNHEALRQALRNALQTTKHPVDIVTIQAAAGLTEDRARTLLESGEPVLLVDVDDRAKDALFANLGIKLAGPARYLLVRPLGERAGRTVYHAIESGTLEETSFAEPAEGAGRFEGPEPESLPTPESGPETEPSETEAVEESSTRILDSFLRAVALLWDADLLDTLDTEDGGPKNHQWFYSRSYPVNQAGAKCQPTSYFPPSQLMNGIVTYSFQAFLDLAESGNFQWLYASTLGHWETRGMKRNDHDHRGWGNGAVGIKVPTPSEFNFYECSPQNANNVSTVTSHVGFDVGYKTGKLAFSKTHQEQLSDWEVTLTAINDWVYQMSSPYPGNSILFPEEAVHYVFSNFRHEIKPWPDLTQYVFNWNTMSAWRTSTVLAGVVTVNPQLYYRPNFIEIDNFWPTWSGCYWIINNPPYYWSEKFNLDMSVVS